MVVLQQPAQALPDLNRPFTLRLHTVDQHVSVFGLYGDLSSSIVKSWTVA